MPFEGVRPIWLRSSTPVVIFPAPSAVKLPARKMGAPLLVAVPVKQKAYLPLRIVFGLVAPVDPVVPPPDVPLAPLVEEELPPPQLVCVTRINSPVHRRANSASD